MTKEAIDVFRNKLEECPYISEQLDSVLKRLYEKCYPDAGYEEDGSMSDYQYGTALFHVVLSITQDEDILLKEEPDREEDLQDEQPWIINPELISRIASELPTETDAGELNALMQVRSRSRR